MTPTRLQIYQALMLVEKALDCNLGAHSRAWLENALWSLRQGKWDEAIDSLCEALGTCKDAKAIAFLQDARNLLAPERFASA